ncbi:hypothetical protein [Candidatus Marithrix sp. Canyon 246]|uniref:hypothetical protein n=1 Tax=Candidatus Marithrix sp. Canyon 246 TaxID=1827136 RepID=UPI00084A24C0|nr:hypothetical protein [Candidatus Marithrix sp. Canyon 246]
MKKTILLPKKVKQQIASASKVASYLWQREWAECNGGNISINMSDLFQDTSLKLSDLEYIEAPNYPKEAGGKIFFVSGTGERLINLK